MRFRTLLIPVFSIVCLILTDRSAAGESAERRDADAAPVAVKEKEAIFLISGPVGGLREARGVIDPRGGSIGVIRTLKALDSGRTAIRLAVGDNLGRALDGQSNERSATRAAIESWDTELVAPPPPRDEAPRSLNCLDGLAEAYRDFEEVPELKNVERLREIAKTSCKIPDLDMENTVRLGQLMRGYKDSSLYAEDCLDKFRKRGLDPEEAIRGLHKCENELLAGEFSKNFAAIAIGEGDFNRFTATDDLSPLRHGLFVAANVFVNKGGNRRRLEDQDRKIEILQENDDKFQYPGRPIKIQFRKAAVRAKLESIKLSSPEGWSVLFMLATEEVQQGQRSEQVFFGWQGASMTPRLMRADWKKSFAEKKDKGTIELTSPIPLLPGRAYSLRLGFQDGSESDLVLETYEGFTRADLSGRRFLRRPFPSVDTPWAADSVPVVKPKGFEDQLRVLAVLDPDIEKKRDRSFCGGAGKGKEVVRACDLRFIGMNEAVKYWRGVLEWLLLQDRFDKLEAFASPTTPGYQGAPPKLDDLVSERKDLDAGGDLPPDERKAWEVIEKRCSASDQFECALDYRLPVVRAALEACVPTPALVVLAQTGREQVLKLADEFPDLLMIVGREVPDNAPRQSAGSFGGIQGPILLFPPEDGVSLQRLKVVMSTASRWRATQATLEEEPVPGVPPRLLWDFKLDGAEECCSAEFLATIDRLLGSDSQTGDFQVDFEKARNHFLEHVRNQMRLDAGAEASLLKPGSFDLSALEWLWLMRRIGNGKKIFLPQASLEELGLVPGIGKLARRVKLENRDTLGKLEAFLGGNRPGAYQWAKHFLQDSKTSAAKPFIFPDRVLARLKERTVLIGDDLEKVTVTAGNLAKTLEAHPDLQRTGLDYRDKKVFVHGVETQAETPVTLALPARLAQNAGEFAELTAEAVQRDKVDGTVSKASLETTLEHLIDPVEGQAPQGVREYDQRSWWMVSMKQIDFEFRRISARDGFSPVPGDARTKSVDSRWLAVKPELEIAWFLPPGRLGEKGSLDWKTSFSTRFERLEVDDDADLPAEMRTANRFSNPVDDEWKVRSEVDFFPWNRIFAFYSAAESVGQYHARFGNLTIGKTAYYFHQPRKREFNLEWGALLTNSKQDLQLRVGFTRNLNLNFVRGIVIGDGDADPVSPDSFREALMALETVPVDERSGLVRTGFVRDRITQSGLAFSGKWSRDLYKWEEDGRKLTFTTKVSEGAFYRRPSQGNSALPRFRMLWESRLTLPVVGNLAVSPGVESYVLYLQRESDGGSRLFVRWIPSFKITYSFDAKPFFQSFWKRGLWFRNKK